MKANDEIEAIELNLLVSAVQQRYGYDFGGYRADFLKRRVRAELKNRHLGSISLLQERILRDREGFDHLLHSLSLTSHKESDKADHDTFIRKHVIPQLRTYPAVRVWQLGEAFDDLSSLVRQLTSGGLQDRATVYFTSPSEEVLEATRKKGVKLKNVAFFQHNPLTDASFNEFHLILCRDLLCHLERPFQERLLELFHGSLCPLGILGLGKKDSLTPFPGGNRYQRLVEGAPFYRRLG